MATDHDNLKDSCNYGVEFSKQLFALSSAAIVFLAGSKPAVESCFSFRLLVASISFFGGSILSGIVFLMGVVGHINKKRNYDVYQTGLRRFAAFQLFSFAVAVVSAGLYAINTAYE